MSRFFLLCIGTFFLFIASALAQTTVTVIGPITPGDCAAFNSTTVIKDSGGTGCTGSGAGVPGGTNGQVQYNNSGNFGGFTASGDATINTGTGVVTLAAVTNAKLAQMPADTVKCNNTGSTANPQDCPAITFPATHQFYNSGSANIQRFNDRVFIAGATANTGTNASPGGDWWSALFPSNNDSPFAQTLILYDRTNPNASLAVPQPALSVAVDAGNAITGSTPRALEFFAYNNPLSGTAVVTVWGLYGEAHALVATSGQTFGFELEIRSDTTTSTAWTPFTQANPSSIGQEIGCGAGLGATHNCTVGMYFASNPQVFGTGILFLNGSVGALAAGSTIGAIEMPASYQIQWYTAGSTIGSSIFGDASSNLNLNVNGGRVIAPNTTVLHLGGFTTTPTLSTCGTSPAISGSDLSGTIVTGTGASACTLTFNAAYATTPTCVITTTNGTTVASSSFNSSSFVISSATAGQAFKFICIGERGI